MSKMLSNAEIDDLSSLVVGGASDYRLAEIIYQAKLANKIQKQAAEICLSHISAVDEEFRAKRPDECYETDAANLALSGAAKAILAMEIKP